MTTALTKTRRRRTVKKKTVENEIINEIKTLLNKRFEEEDLVKANLLLEALQEYRKVIAEYNDIIDLSKKRTSFIGKKRTLGSENIRRKH